MIAQSKLDKSKCQPLRALREMENGLTSSKETQTCRCKHLICRMETVDGTSASLTGRRKFTLTQTRSTSATTSTTIPRDGLLPSSTKEKSSARPSGNSVTLESSRSLQLSKQASQLHPRRATKLPLGKNPATTSPPSKTLTARLPLSLLLQTSMDFQCQHGSLSASQSRQEFTNLRCNLREPSKARHTTSMLFQPLWRLALAIPTKCRLLCPLPPMT